MACFPPPGAETPTTFAAYLLLQLDISTSPPRVKDVVIRSEESPSIILGNVQRYVCLLKETGRSYDEADRALRRRLAEDPYWAWVLRTLKPRTNGP